MRRQVITAGLLSLALAAMPLTALADDENFSSHTDTNGPGYDVRVDVWNHPHSGAHTRSGDRGGDGKNHDDGPGEATSVDGLSQADAWAAHAGYASAANYSVSDDEVFS